MRNHELRDLVERLAGALEAVLMDGQPIGDLVAWQRAADVLADAQEVTGEEYSHAGFDYELSVEEKLDV